MRADQHRVAAEVAARVRGARAQRRWTLDELAARSTVSRRLIVQIEHAEANPSLATLLKLAAALGLSLADLLSDTPETTPVAVVPGPDAMTLWSTPAGSAARLLVSHGPLELWSWILLPGDRRTSEAHRPGSLELVTVLTGTVALDVGDHHADIPAGDSAWLDATHPHAYSNPETTPAHFTLVVLEPA
jgi:DNA-binding XRE family transcriptional regulator